MNDKSSFRNLISNGKGNMPAFKNISAYITRISKFYEEVLKRRKKPFPKKILTQVIVDSTLRG